MSIDIYNTKKAINQLFCVSKRIFHPNNFFQKEGNKRGYFFFNSPKQGTPLKASSPTNLTLAGIITLLKLEQSRNVPRSMAVKPSGRVILLKLSHSANAKTPIVVKPSGRVMRLKLLHPENAPSPMVVKPSGRVMRLILVHPSNALSPMVVTPSGRFMLLKLVHL